MASGKERKGKKTSRAAKRELRKKYRQTGAEAGFLRGRLFRVNAGAADAVVIIMVVLFSLFGAAMVFSAGYYQTINTSNPNPFYYLIRQGIFVISGWFLMYLASRFDYHRYEKVGMLFLAISIILLVLVLVIGQNVNGAVRWINLGFFRFTPSEFSKIFIIIFTSAYLVRDPKNIRSVKGLFVLVLVMAAHFLLIVRQPNLSTAIVIVMIMIAIMIVAGNGGLKGLGFGKSISKNMYLPEPQNDFILAILGEELGYIGFLFLMAAYIFLIFRLMMIALKAEDRLGFYLATGVAVMLGLQVVINVAVVTSSMPATGITLPFISYGGTSMWSFMIAMGIALNVSRSRKIPLQAQGKAEDE